MVDETDGRGGAVARDVEHGPGAFLRSRRERLDPGVLGLPSTGRRRTPGLRREEVAARAGISVEWYTRLEQGRGGSPSAAVLQALARALLLTPAEHEHLLLLSRGDDPAPSAGPLSPQYARLLAGLPLSPAYVKSAAWDVLAWNDAARAVLTDYPALAPGERNVLRILFCTPAARSLLVDWEHEARLAVATFRLELSRWGGEQARATVERLRSDCADFARLWDDRDVGTLGQGTKHLQHPEAGRLALWYSSYAVDDAPGLGLVVYTPETDADADRVRRLLDEDHGGPAGSGTGVAPVPG